MTAGAGVVRSEESLRSAADALASLAIDAGPPTSTAGGELRNLATVADALLAAATERTESRGSHVRAEHPDRDERWQRRIIHGGSA